jgi:hypothetical protein
MEGTLRLSSLPKTWIFDLDGTLVVHNGFLSGSDSLLPGVREMFESLPSTDFVIITTSRSSEYRAETEKFLVKSGIKYNLIVFDLPTGERILFNDIKVSGLVTAFAINCERNAGFSDFRFFIDPTL